MKVLVVGATGHYAHLIVPALVAQGVEVRALVRKPDQATGARQLGAAEIAVGDLRDTASLAAAVRGVDGVFHLGPVFAPDEAAMGERMVAAAQAAGVRKLVFSSVMHPSLPLSNHAAKRPVEAALYESGLEFTVLQPAMFMQNLADSVHQARTSVQLVMPYSSQAKMCYVDYRDVAEVAALAFTTDRLRYGTFELSAPGLLDRPQLATLLSEVLGQPVAAGEVSPEQGVAQMGLPPGPQHEGMLAMFTHYNQYGFAGGNALVLEAILGRPPRSLRQYLQELAGQAA
ncbi:SDR family oxidoreductase [Dyadobacter arcticus]|nr:NmrA family NAD(P)-binding protein [Dyadobacter arcticus]